MKILLFILLTTVSGTACVQDTLTIKDISAAERVIGLQFTNSERDSLFDAVKSNRQDYEKMRQYKLDNSVPLSSWQNPILPGMQFNMKQNPVKWNFPENLDMPANKNELAFYSILQLASLIKYKKISSIELTRFLLNA